MKYHIDTNVPLIYHGECYHLFCDNILSDNCLKRYFYIFDFVGGQTKTIAICNDFLRLLIYERKASIKRVIIPEEHPFFVGRIIEELLLKEIQFDDYSRRGLIGLDRYNIAKQNIFIPICKRPFIGKEISLIYAIEFYIKNKNPELKRLIQKCVIQFINNIEGIKKYITVKDTLTKRINKIGDWNITDNETFINDLFIDILHFKTLTT